MSSGSYSGKNSPASISRPQKVLGWHWELLVAYSPTPWISFSSVWVLLNATSFYINVVTLPLSFFLWSSSLSLVRCRSLHQSCFGPWLLIIVPTQYQLSLSLITPRSPSDYLNAHLYLLFSWQTKPKVLPQLSATAVSFRSHCVSLCL